METPAWSWSYLFSSLAGQSRRTRQAGAPRTAWIPLAVVSLEWDGDGELSSQGPPCGTQGTGEEQARVHSPGPPQLLGAPALRSTAGDNRRLSGEAAGRSPHTRPPRSPASYPGTAVQAWHARDTLVSLLSFFQECHWVGCLPLDAVPADALTRKRRGQRGMGPRRPGRAEWGNSTLNSAMAPRPAVLPRPRPHPLSPQPHPCGSFAPSSEDPIPALALSLLQEAALWGQARATFQTGVWEEVEGPAEGPSVPAVPATCTHCEDTPRGFGLQRPAPNTSFSARGSKGAAAGGARPFADTLWGGAGPPAPADLDCHGLPSSSTHGGVSLDPWAGAPAPRSLCTAQPGDGGWH